MSSLVKSSTDRSIKGIKRNFLYKFKNKAKNPSSISDRRSRIRHQRSDRAPEADQAEGRTSRRIRCRRICRTYHSKVLSFRRSTWTGVVIKGHSNNKRHFFRGDTGVSPNITWEKEPKCHETFFQTKLSALCYFCLFKTYFFVNFKCHVTHQGGKGCQGNVTILLKGGDSVNVGFWKVSGYGLGLNKYWVQIILVVQSPLFRLNFKSNQGKTWQVKNHWIGKVSVFYSDDINFVSRLKQFVTPHLRARS